MTFFQAPVLENNHVRLELLNPAHHDDLVAAVTPGQPWHTWYASIPAPENMAQEIQTRLEHHRQQHRVPWAIMDTSTGRAVGMTSFLNLAPQHRRVEIGATWLGQTAQGTKINAATKLLLLTRAFETLECVAVEFRTHTHNSRSRAAIEKLGAKLDGILRNHMIIANGTLRDTATYSIIEAEWPTVRAGLQHRLDH